MSEERDTLILGSLLYGIDRYLQLGGLTYGRAVGDVPDFAPNLVAAWKQDFAKCVDAEVLEALVTGREDVRGNGHAEGPTPLSRSAQLLALIQKAEALAAPDTQSPHGTRQRIDTTTRRLLSVFDRLELTGPHPASGRRLPFAALTASDADHELPIFPSEDPGDVDSLRKHIADFREALYSMRQRLDWTRFDCVYTHILTVLQTFGWCLPWDLEAEDPDISLYDKRRVASALAVSSYGSGNDDILGPEAACLEGNPARCLLLAGGVFGIQDYIYDISTIGAGGVAKRLRARSFHIQLLSDAACLRILRLFSLPLANVTMSSGGRFYVLLPRTADADQSLEGLQREFDKWVLANFHGLVAVNFAWVPLSDGDFVPGGYSSALGRLQSLVSARNSKWLAGALQGPEGWKQEFSREPFKGATVCASCGRFPATRSTGTGEPGAPADACEQCDGQRELGRRLTRGGVVSFFADGTGKIPCLGLSASVDATPRIDAFLTVRLNDPNILIGRTAGKVPSTFRYIANHVPMDPTGYPQSFEEIAGKGLLGIVKADVDYLGLIFHEGLRRDEQAQGWDSVSRVSALSRQLDLFFTGWVQWLVTNKFSDCYTVYSGGDDLLVIGPRKRALAFARRVRERFAAYTSHPELTISAGIALVKSRLPLAHTVTEADAALDRAKGGGRDRVSLLGETVKWDTLARLDKIIGILATSKPPSAFLYRLLQAAEMYRQFADPERRDIRGLRFLPVLAEALARNVDRTKQSELFDWGVRLLDIRESGGEPTNPDLPIFGLATQWVILERREQ